MQAAIMTDQPQSLLIDWATEHLRSVGYEVSVLTQAEVAAYQYDLVIYEYSPAHFSEWQPILDNLYCPLAVIYQKDIADSIIMRWQPAALQQSEKQRQQLFDWVKRHGAKAFWLCTDEMAENTLQRWGIDNKAIGSLATPVISEQSPFQIDPHQPSEPKPVMLLNGAFEPAQSRQLLSVATALAALTPCRFIVPTDADPRLNGYNQWLKQEIAAMPLAERCQLLPWQQWSMQQQPVVITLTHYPQNYRLPMLDYLRVNGVPILSFQDTTGNAELASQLLNDPQLREQKIHAGYQQCTENALFDQWGEIFLGFIYQACQRGTS